MKLKTAISERIKALLNERQMTQYQVFKNTGVPQSTISTIMSEKDKTCKILTIAQIAEAFDMGLKEFFDSEIFAFENIEID